MALVNTSGSELHLNGRCIVEESSPSASRGGSFTAGFGVSPRDFLIHPDGAKRLPFHLAVHRATVGVR